MIRTYFIGTRDGTASRLAGLIDAPFYVAESYDFPSTMKELVRTVSGAERPDIVVLDPGTATDEALTLTRELHGDYGVAVVLVSDDPARIGLAAMRAGAVDIIDPAAPDDDMFRALERAEREAIAMHPAPAPAPVAAPTNGERKGQIISVASPKGGVGKTTVATNLAVGLARKAPQSTVLVDLDLHFGDVASALNLQHEYSVTDVTTGAATHDAMAMKSLLALHKTGLYVVPGSDSPAAADAVTPQELVNLLETLAEQFTYVVVDTAPGLGEHTLVVLDRTDLLVMVTSLDVPGVRGLRKELDTLTDLGMLIGHRKVVLNFYDTNRGLSVRDVEATINAKVDLVIPQSNVVPVSVNQGIPLVESDGADPVSKSMRALVDLVASNGSDAGPKQGLFSSVFKSRGGNR